MIPLSPSEKVEKFPKQILFIVFFLLIFNITFLFGSALPLGERLSVLVNQDRWGIFWPLGMAPFFPHVFSMFVNLWYFWVLGPKVFEKSHAVFLWFLIFSVLMISGHLFLKIYPDSPLPLLPEAWIGGLLGVYLRHGIWSTLTTLVPGPGWIRLYEVPSYVLLFFWFFYLLISNFFLDEPYSLIPMPYLIPFVALLVGFFAESIRLSLLKALKKGHNQN